MSPPPDMIFADLAPSDDWNEVNSVCGETVFVMKDYVYPEYEVYALILWVIQPFYFILWGDISYPQGEVAPHL